MLRVRETESLLDRDEESPWARKRDAEIRVPDGEGHKDCTVNPFKPNSLPDHPLQTYFRKWWRGEGAKVVYFKLK